MSGPFVQQNGDGVAIPESNQIVVSTSVSVLVGANNIGFAQSLTPNFTRKVERIRHLNADDAGRIVEQAPGPEDYTISMTGFAVYPNAAANNPGSPQSAVGTLLERILGSAPVQSAGALAALAFRCLSSQIVPFSASDERRKPGFSNVVGRIRYVDNWMTSFSSPVAIGNVMLTETVAAQPTYIG